MGTIGMMTACSGIGYIIDGIYSWYRYEKLKVANSFIDHLPRIAWRIPAGAFLFSVGMLIPM